MNEKLTTIDLPFAIIAGANRCGSSSLYYHLGAHPQVCPSNLKETRFFLDRSYPIHARARAEEGLARYLQYFADHEQGQILLESSPQYLYSPGTAKRLAAALPNAKLIFILRRPSERLKSIFLHGRQIGRLPLDLSYPDWIERQFELIGSGQIAQDHAMRALEQGCYAPYLKEYVKTFEREDILVTQLGELRQDPGRVLAAVCAFLRIEGKFYDGFDFRRHNPARGFRWSGLHGALLALQRMGSNRLADYPRIRSSLGTIYRQVLLPIYYAFNSGATRVPEIPADLQRKIDGYYQSVERDLAAVLGVEKFEWI